YRIPPEDRPPRTPPEVAQLLARAARAGRAIGTLCTTIHQQDGPLGVRRILGVLALAKRYGVATVETACPPALARGVPTYPRLRQAQAERLAPLDLVAALVTDELVRRQDRLLERRRTHARFRDPGKTLDTFDFDFNKKMDRARVFELATGRFIAAHDDALFLGPPGTGKSHLAQAIGHAAIQQGYRVRYAEAHGLLDELAEASVDGTRREKMTELATVPLLIIDDLGMR